jgi:hypothetical protein
VSCVKRKFSFPFLWLYSPILGLGRLRETFSFISVTRSRTVDEMGGACSTNGEKRNAYRILVGKPEGKNH